MSQCSDKRYVLRQPEESPYGADSAGTAPEEASLCAPIPGVGVEHVRREDIRNDAGHIVEIPRKDDSLGTKTGGCKLSDE